MPDNTSYLPDQDDNPFDTDGESEVSADLAKMVSDKLAADDEADEDLGGFGADMPEKDLPDMVGEEEGTRMSAEARLKRESRKVKPDEDEPKVEKIKAAEKDEPKVEKDAAASTEKTEDAGTGDGKTEAVDWSSKSAAELAAAVPEAVRGEVSKRLTEAELVQSLFAEPEIAAEIKRHGADPRGAMARLIQMSQFAYRKPGEYLAYVAQAQGDKMRSVFEEAAGFLGLKLVDPSEDNDNPWDDDDEKAELRAEIQRLKQSEPPAFGPDSPAEREARAARDARLQADRSLYEFQSAVDETGNLKHPRFKEVQDYITTLGREIVLREKRHLTAADLPALYERAVKYYDVDHPQVAPSSTQTDEAKAAAVAKAKAASKSQDGVGQGAGRRPELRPGASLREQIMHEVNLRSAGTS